MVLGALLFAGAMADGGEPSWVGLVAGPLCAALGWLAVGGLVERARSRLDDSAAVLLTVYADGAALLLAALAVFVPPVSFVALIGFVVLSGRWPPPRGREVRRPADPSLVPAATKKLVLAVIDSLKPEMLDRAIEEGQAPALANARRAGHLRARLRVDVPVGDARGERGDRHRPRPGRAPHPRDELVPPRRGALRRVRLLVAGHARVRRRALALRHRLQHEPGAPLARAPDGLRAPRRRRSPHRVHDLPDLPRAHAARSLGRERVPPDRGGGAVPPRRLRRPRAVLRRPVRLARHRLHVRARHAGPARSAHRLRRRLPGGARPVRLPALLAAGQRHLLAQGRARRPGALDRGGRPGARADHARGRGVPRRSSRSTR